MKRKFIIPLSALLVILLSSHKPDSLRKQPKFSIAPPGTVWLRDSLFIDETEVENIDWLEYCYWTAAHDPDHYISTLPDTLVDHRKLVLQDPYVDYYFRHPAYREYPVVGISYEQALAYCEWRTDRVNEYLAIRYKEAKWENINDYTIKKRVQYRLPTKDEWQYAASAGLNAGMYPKGYEVFNIKTGRPYSVTFEYNIKAKTDCYRKLTDKERKQGKWRYNLEDDRSPVFYGKPNAFGIYNLLGNVSELIQDTIVKGYNYMTYSDGLYAGDDAMFQYKYPDSVRDAYYKNDFRYNGPQAWLGFRCVCEVLKGN